jgi:adenylylsulfate kinase-like enzyme
VEVTTAPSPGGDPPWSLLGAQPVVVVTGVSAAGKSTVAEALARRFARGVHVRGDAFRRMVVTGREEMSATPSDEAVRQLELRYRLGATTANAYWDAGFSVVVQDVILGSHLHQVVQTITARPIVVIVLVPSVAVVEAREMTRLKTAYRGDVTPTLLDHALRTERPRIGLWLDTYADRRRDRRRHRPARPPRGRRALIHAGAIRSRRSAAPRVSRGWRTGREGPARDWPASRGGVVKAKPRPSCTVRDGRHRSDGPHRRAARPWTARADGREAAG